MALLPILHYPDSRLNKMSLPIKVINSEIRQLSQDMLETMYAAPGVGLAAPQINRLIRIIVLDVSEDKNQPLVLINPVIVTRENIQINEEGCLSVPDIFAEVERAEIIQVNALDENNQPIAITASGLQSVCIQHEIDHLDGKLFIRYLSKLKQERIFKKNQKHSG